MRSRELVSVAVAAALVVISALGALKFKRERDVIRSTLTKYAAAVPIAMVSSAGAQAPMGVTDMVRKAKGLIARGQYALAREQLDRLRRQAPVRADRADTEPEENVEVEPPRRRQRGPGERPLGQPLGLARGWQGRQVSPEAREFFESHPGLNRRAQALAGAVMAKRREGEDVRQPQELLRRVIETAEEGDAGAVEELLRRTERALGGAPKAPEAPGERRQGRPGGRPPRQAQALQRKWAELREAARKAEAEGKDTRPLAELLPKIREAMEKDDVKRAEQLLDEGTARLERARPSPPRTRQRRGRGGPADRPRGAGPGRRPQAPGMAGVRRLIEMLIATMTQEQEALNKARDSMTNAELALREKNQEQVREILQTARAELARIEHGRRALVELAREGVRRPSEPGARERAARPPSLRLEGPLPVPFIKPREAVGHIGDAFDRVRTLTDDDYAAGKPRLALALLERVFSLPEEPEKKAEDKPVAGAPVTEDVVRQKLESAEEPYREAKAADAERAQEAERLLGEVRRLLYEGKYDEADEVLDRALAVLGVAAPEPVGGAVSEEPRREEHDEATDP